MKFVFMREGVYEMAKKGPRVIVKLRSTESAHMYLTEKNRRNDTNRLELRKYDPTLRKHVVYRETK
jgi:large subunit ribosomal protein L33